MPRPIWEMQNRKKEQNQILINDICNWILFQICLIQAAPQHQMQMKILGKPKLDKRKIQKKLDEVIVLKTVTCLIHTTKCVIQKITAYFKDVKTKSI